MIAHVDDAPEAAGGAPAPERAGPGRVSKVLIAGPVGVGKTTATRSASDVPVLHTEARPTDATRALKSATTVAMDFGVLRLDAAHVVHLYGTPGQRRFDFMWDILSSGGAGVVVLVDGSDRAPPREVLGEYLDAFGELVARGRLALGVTRLVRRGRRGLEPWHREMERRGLLVPVFEADPRVRRDVEMLVRGALAGADAAPAAATPEAIGEVGR